MSVLPKHFNNNIQAVRVILSQLYIIWATDGESTRLIHETIQGALLDAQATPLDRAVEKDGDGSGNAAVAGRSGSGSGCLVDGSKATSGAARAALIHGKENNTRAEHGHSAAPSWHADPTLQKEDSATHYTPPLSQEDSIRSAEESNAGSSPPKDSPIARRSASPSATPPGRSSSYLRPDEARAFVQPRMGSGFLGVDEIDYANAQHNHLLHHTQTHRLGQPGSYSSVSPPGIRPTGGVDSHAPLPHATAGGSSSSSIGSSGASSSSISSVGYMCASATLEKAEGASLLSSSHAAGDGAGAVTSEQGWNKVGREDGSEPGWLTANNISAINKSATTTTTTITNISTLSTMNRLGCTDTSMEVACAEEDEIPTFYTNELSRGVTSAINESEYAILKDLLAELGSTATVVASGEDEAATSNMAMTTVAVVNKAQFGDISLGAFKVATWLKDLLFESIAVHAGVPRNTETLPVTEVMRFYEEVYGKLSPTRRLFELIRGTESTETGATSATTTTTTGIHNTCDKDGADDKASRSANAHRGSGDFGLPLSSEYIDLEQLKSMTAYLVATHPGLEFLKQPEFQEYYCRTVAIRIMYSLERQQCGKVYWHDFDRSNLPDKITILDTMDVNQVLEYFSYEHFYVLYCKFWELDTDRDLLVDFDDMCNYGQGSIVPAVIRRVVDGYGRKLSSNSLGQLNYEDFVYFCLSEEDKNTDAAVLYWFKVLDVDSDGILSGYELNLFYRENYQRFLEYSDGAESEVAYEDAMCQMLDLLGFARVHAHKTGVTLADLRSCLTPANFFNMIFNASKFMLFEHRDPFAEHQQRLWPEKTEWDRFARTEYDRMASEAQ